MKTPPLKKVLKTIVTGGILITLMPAVFSLEAVESEVNGAPGSVRSTEQPGTNEEQNQKSDIKQASTTGSPQAENLKNRELGAAFRRFRPSEAISADNAVPFPVDI